MSIKTYPAGQGERKEANTRFVSTGEKRCPKKGEYFLSGAIIEAYEAKVDLTTVYHIAKPVKVKRITMHENEQYQIVT